MAASAKPSMPILPSITSFWKTELPEMNLPYGMFGENFTTEGLSFEDGINVGDRFRVGEAELMATEPRLPCYKLGIKFDAPDILRRFLKSRRTGFYFAVVKEGIVEAGNEIELLSRDPNNVTIADITRLYAFEKADFDTMRRAIKLDSLVRKLARIFQESKLKSMSPKSGSIELALRIVLERPTAGVDFGSAGRSWKCLGNCAEAEIQRQGSDIRLHGYR